MNITLKVNRKTMREIVHILKAESGREIRIYETKSSKFKHKDIKLGEYYSIHYILGKNVEIYEGYLIDATSENRTLILCQDREGRGKRIGIPIYNILNYSII